MRVIDLSHPIVTGMPVYPGDPEVTVSESLTVQTDGVAVARLELGSHSGTHLDAPSHSIVGGRTVERLSLDRLHGPAFVLHVSPSAREAITLQSVFAQLPDAVPAIVCIATGWDVHFGSPQGLAHPFVSVELATELWKRGCRVLGVDTLSPDPTDPADTGMPVHALWLGGDGIIVENLRGLRSLPSRCEMSLLPLALAGVDGSPIRAVALIPDEAEDAAAQP